jgi:DNA-binding HxlR family transcriptional regulator
VRRKSFEEMNCSVAQTLEVIGEWWTMLIVRDCFLGVTRFDEFRERLGIARNILADRLEHLVDRGVLVRVPYQANPIRHDYRLTEKGKDLWLVLMAMRQWGDRWEAPEGAPVLIEHSSCHHEATVLATCSACGEAIGARSVKVIPGPGAVNRPAAALATGPAGPEGRKPRARP